MCTLPFKSQSENVEQSSSRMTSGNSPSKSDAVTPAQESASYYLEQKKKSQLEKEAKILAELKSFTVYDPDSGNFIITRYRQGTNKGPGTILGSLRKKDNYLEARVGGSNQLLHRLVWLWHYGYLPTEDIDHINGIGTDNRISNLREVPHFINNRNSKLSIANNSGHVGVFWHKKACKWQAQVTVGYESIYLGLHLTLEAAVKAREDYLAANPQLGFTGDHGKKRQNHTHNSTKPIPIQLTPQHKE